ncbi:hypothetical protein LAZ67_15003191 [Cordylochernes scorpioides]|uniref:Reverse transcriptase domain-containing protein n=1 Tax=Cordylochernes scorpioides TaxID=51811 RepID=A0ABY6LA54_9ARAC|nr:hypothetical protein LAZ67_15003191 [Cordylochernes scorpioides]
MPGHRKRRQFKQTDAFTRGMVIGLKRAGWSIRQIAADTHLGASTVHRLWRRWLEQGNVAIYRNAGATRVTSARVDRRILRQAVAAPQVTCTAILQHVQDTLDPSISTRTISRRLVANGLHSCRPLRRLPLTPPNRRQRLEWCRARSTWMTEWHRVVFSDESRFCLSSDSRRVRVWRRRGERSNPAAIVERPTVRQRGIMVWGAIAYDSRSPLLRIQGTMTAQRYVDDVLRPVTLPYLQGVPNALYQQDNARPHTARISQQALQDVQMLPWPPYSPDLSPIEHVWDIIGHRLHALPQPRSEDELWQMVEREWRAIPQDAIRTLIDSLPRRFVACIAVRGPRMSKQTTLETSLDRDKEIKDLINALTKRLDNWGERLESRLSAIDDRVENINQRLQQLEESSAVTKSALSQNSKKIKDLEDQLEYLDAKSRERNLIFYGIEQDINEDCRERIRRVIEENMRTTEKINITRCHRVSRKPGAPILVEVPEQNDRTTLFKAAFNLRGTKISLSKDYSMKMREQRRVLNVKRRELVEKGTLAKLRDNKLIINGIAYKADRKQSLVNSQPIDKLISNTMSIQPLYDKTLTAKTSKIKNSKAMDNIPDRNTTKIRYTHTKNCESAIKDKQVTQAKHIDTKIKILQWNINGFNRITSIFPLVEYLKKYELFALNETWITGVIELLTDEYYIIQSPAMKTELKGRGSGGILIGIKKNFQHTVRKIETNPYWISVLTHKFLDKTTESICLLFAYLPPNALQEQNLTNLLRHIDYHMSEGNEVLIAGDINIRIGNAGGFHNPLKLNSPLNKYRKSKDLISSKLSEKLISFTDSNSITIANGRTKGDTHGSFTFISERGSSVLDYFMYTHGLTQIISDMWIEELSYSDHLPIVLQINTGYEAIKSSYKNEILTRKFIWTKENVEMLKHNLSDIEVGNETDINTETANFTKQIYTAMESANIIKFAKRRHQLSKPWYDKDCYIMKKTTKVSLQRCRNSNNIHDRQKYIEARREYFKLLQRKRDEFNKDKNERIKNAKDPKSFWNAIASFRKKPIIQGEIDIKEWFLFYKNLLNKENKEATFTVNQMIGWKDPDLDAEITLEEIHDVVKKLANGKAVGLDGIPNELLKNLPIPTLNKLKNLFNKIMSTEKYPQLWTNSIVHPIYKSGDKNNPTNYRGIALCSNISKLFTTILRNRLNNWIEKRMIILENQAGFRKNRSCTDHIILLNSLIQLSLRRKRGKLYVFFVDLTKAFDTVPHDLLWQKLHKMGISNKFVMLIKNFYQEAKITIRWKGQYSNNVKINSGVLQGESLSPLLFILYMADLIELYNNSALTGFHLPDFGVLHLLMYADDIAIIGESKINLQIKINLLKSYLDKNKLVLNENKSKIIVFRNGGRPARHENWYWGDTPLTVASNITYLGYPFTSTINSKKVALFYKAKANTAINATIRLIKKEKINSSKVALNLFDSVIKSILLYAAPVWAWDNTDIIDQLQNTFIKNFLNLPRYIPGYIVRLETGRISLTFTTIKLILKYFIRLQKMEDNRLPKLCWNRLKEISLMTKKPIGFCKNIMDIINHCGLTWLNYRLNYDDIQIELPNILKIKIEQLLQQDLAKLSLTKTYSNYRLLYDSFIPENYFSCYLSSALVSFIAQIRLMSTMIKENHIYAIKKEDLYCGLCGSQITDEIYHFIAECGDLEGERKKILKSLPRPHSNSIKLIKTVSDKKSWAIELFNFQKAVGNKIALMEERRTGAQ